MSHPDSDPQWVPEADRVEQQTPVAPETENADSLAVTHVPDGADEADVLEQATPLPGSDDDYQVPDRYSG